MKKVTLLMICIVGFIFADWVKVIGTSESPLPPRKWVMASDSLFVFIRNETFGFIKEDTVVDLENFQHITISEEPVGYDTNNIGKPQIPYIRLLIAVPDSADFDITVYPTDYTLFEDYLIYPVPQIVFETDTAGHVYSREIFTYDAFFYQKDTIYPDKFYEIKNDGHWRDQRVLEVFLYPVQFNPQERLMYFYTNIDLRIEYLGEVIENTNGLGPFEDMGHEILLNYSGDISETREELAPSVHYYTDLLNPENIADYIIVTHDDFLNNPTAQQWIDDFAWWRVNHNRFDVGIVDIIDIYDQFDDSLPDSARALKEFLIHAYDNWYAPHISDGHFAYCLFIGDWDYVPTQLYLKEFPDIGVWLVAEEQYFQDLNGRYDIMLGRWPVKAATGHDIENLVTIAQKTIDYEKYPNTTGNWRRRGFLIAGHNDAWWDFDSYVDASKGYLSDISYDTFTVYRSDFMPPDGPSQEFFNSISYYLNHGEILTAYFDHGSATAWYHYDTSYVKDLTNGTRLPAVLSLACLTAIFQWDHPFYSVDTNPGYPGGTSFGEHFLFNPNGGTVVFYGAPRPVYGVGHGVEIIEAILQDQNWILGKALVTPYYYGRGYCLLGDPALDLGDYTAYPDLPDLVVRPQGIDISLLIPHPYLTNGDVIPVKAKVWNIGGETAYDVGVDFRVKLGTDVLHTEIVTIDSIQPRDSVVVAACWNPADNFPGYYGEIGDCEFIVEVDPASIITESWEYNNYSSIIKKVALYPYLTSWPKELPGCSQPAIADLDNSGSVEIICPALGWLYVFDKDGNTFSNWPQPTPDIRGVVLGDINNDNKVEIIVVTYYKVMVYNWEGDTLWTREVIDFHPSGCVINRPPSLGRIADASLPYLDVVVVLDPGDLYPFKVLVFRYNGDLLYEFDSEYSIWNDVNFNPASISDINDDGKAEIVVSSIGPDEHGFTTIFNKDGLVATLDYGSGFMTPALAKLDADNYPDIITGGSDGIIRAYNAKDNTILWQTQTGGQINSSPAVGNINTQPLFIGKEIAFGNDINRIFAIRGDDGEWWYPWWFDVNGPVQTSPALAYIDNNPGLDIIIGANDQYIYALNYNREPISPFPLPLFGQPSSPIIGDIDGDSKSEIILSSSDGYLHVWNNISRTALAYPRLEWPQIHHDFQRTGFYGWYDRISVIPKLKVSLQEFSTATTVSCFLNTNLQTQITIYNSQGEIVKTLTNQQLSTGDHQFDWDGTDNKNNLLPNGSYTIEMKTEQGIEIISVEINR